MGTVRTMTSPAASHRITTDPTGAPILVKQVRGEDGRARLRSEAALLRDLAHPGLVQVVDLVEDGEDTELHLAWVGPHSLATVTSVPVADAGRVVAQVSEVVADLHDRGTTHGRLTADHVLLGRDARPVLTGLAGSVRGWRGNPVADVGALGALLTQLVRPLHDGAVIPDRRRRRGRDTGLAGALLTVADLAATDDPAIRPSARDLARRIRAVVDPADDRPRRRARLPRRHRPEPDITVAPRPPTRLDIAPLRIRRHGDERPAGEERPAGDGQPHPTAPPPTADEPQPAPPLDGAARERSPDGPTPARPSIAPVPEGPDSPRPSPAAVVPAGAPDDERARPVTRRDPHTRTPPDARAGAAGSGASRTLSPRSPARALGATRPDGPAPRHRRVAVAVLAAAVLTTLVAALALRPEPTADMAVRALPSTTSPRGPSTTTRPPPTSAAEEDETRPLAPGEPDDGGAGCPPVAPPAADIDGDGCPDALAIERERVSAAGTTWVVGRPGDAVVVADWDCDGTATVASLRPSTGEVFVFDRWVAAGDELTVRASTTVPGADTLRARDDDGDGCATLTATAPDGAATTVPVRTSR